MRVTVSLENLSSAVPPNKVSIWWDKEHFILIVILFQLFFPNCYLFIRLIHSWSKTVTVIPRVLPAYQLLDAPFSPIIIFGILLPVGWSACIQCKTNKYPICLQPDSPFILWCSTVYCSRKQSLCCCFQAFCDNLFVCAQRHTQIGRWDSASSCILCQPSLSLQCLLQQTKPTHCFLSYEVWILFCLKSFQYLGSFSKRQSLVLLTIDLSLICKTSSAYKIIIVLSKVHLGSPMMSPSAANTLHPPSVLELCDSLMSYCGFSTTVWKTGSSVFCHLQMFFLPGLFLYYFNKTIAFCMSNTTPACFSHLIVPERLFFNSFQSQQFTLSNDQSVRSSSAEI